MPAKSGKQYRFFQFLRSNPKERMNVGISKEDVNEMIHKTPKKKRSIFMRGEEREKNRLQPPRNITGARG